MCSLISGATACQAVVMNWTIRSFQPTPAKRPGRWRDVNIRKTVEAASKWSDVHSVGIYFDINASHRLLNLVFREFGEESLCIPGSFLAAPRALS